MKKINILLILILMILPKNVYAFSANVSCSAPSTVTVGDTFNVTISGSSDAQIYWQGDMINSSSNLRLNSGTGSDLWEEGTSQINRTYSFTAISEGEASINQTINVSDSEGNEDSITSSTCYITVVSPAPVTNNDNNSYNDNSNNDNSVTKEIKNDENKSLTNYLKSLKVEGYSITPKFNKEVLEYTLTVTSDIQKLKIIVEKENENLTVSGDGEVQIKDGNNSFTIAVKDSEGNVRNYILKVYKEEKGAIVVKVNNKNYTLIKKIVGVNAPVGFEKKTININKEEVESFYNDKIKYNLVVLKDSVGNLLLYIYDNDNYIKYSPIISSTISIVVLDANDVEIPSNYKKVKFKYNNEEIYGYKIKKNSNFALIYAIDTTTGKKGFYQYDIKYNTLQRFNNDQEKVYQNTIEKCKYAFIIIGSVILILVLIIIILLSKNVKFKKMYIKKLSSIDNIKPANEVKYQSIEETTIINEDKKEKKHKKEKTFLDE